jgi:MATE family multidrug resistance protein
MNKELLRLAIPNILTNLTVPLVSMVDLGLMGRMPSTAYIVAIGFGTVIFNFIYWAFGFLRMGTTGMVSQAYGRDNHDKIKGLLTKGLSISLIGGLVLVLLQWPLKEFALLLIDPDTEVIKPLITYFNYRIYAAPATISIYVLTGWLLGMQDSKAALFLAVVVNGINAVLSYTLVHSFQLDIAGVAMGTVIAQYIGLIFGFVILWRKYQLTPVKLFSSRDRSSSSWASFISVNSDILIRTLCLIFTMSFFKTKAGNIDPILGAANILLLEFITISAYGIDGFAFAAESICGKYFGKSNKELFMKSIKVSMSWGIGIAFILSFIYWAFGEEILSLLTNKTSVIEAALVYLPWLIIAPLINAFAFIWDGIYVGAIASKAMRNAMIFSTFFIFLPAFFLGKNLLMNHGMWLAFSLFMLARGLIQTLMVSKHIYRRI